MINKVIFSIFIVSTIGVLIGIIITVKTGCTSGAVFLFAFVFLPAFFTCFEFYYDEIKK